MKNEALAMIFNEVEKPFLPLPVNLPALSLGETLVEIIYTTISTSDLHSFFGRRDAHFPSVLGHEVVGRIARLPENGLMDFYGQALKIGDLVTWSVYAHDHRGMMANKGIPQRSEPLFKYGHERIALNDVLSGGFATHCHLRQGTDIFKIPAGISLKEAAPLNCTHPTIAGAIRLAGTTVNENNVVYKSLQQAINQLGHDFSLENVLLNRGGKEKLQAIRDILKPAYSSKEELEKNAQIAFADFLAILKEAYESLSVKTYHGTLGLFAFLHKRGIKTALNTGYNEETALSLLDKLNWKEAGHLMLW